MNEEGKPWCKLVITIDCGSTEDALKAMLRILMPEDDFRTIHQNSISKVEIIKQ